MERQAPKVMKKELEKILEDQEFVKELVSEKTREDAKKAIEAKGVSVTDEEMEEIYKIYSAVYDECSKMSKEDLLKVAGGGGKGHIGFFTAIKNFFVGDPVSQNTGGLFDASDVSEGVKYVVGKVENHFDEQTKQKNKDQKIRMMGESNKAKELENEKEANQSKNTTLRIATGAAAVLATAYLFKDEIKSWIRKK